MTSLDALSEHTAQGRQWLVAGLEYASLTQAVHTLGVDSPLELEGWAVVSGHLIPHCLLKVELWKCLMTVSKLQCFQNLWQLFCLWSAHC